MRRVPEPELMLDPDQAEAYSSADFAQAHQAFVSLLQQRLPHLPQTASVLDLGCGPCDVTQRVALAYPNWRIVAIDGSPAMLTLGSHRLARAELQGRVRLELCVLPEQEPSGGPFDVVISNSLLHHLQEPAVLWRAIGRHTTKGGSIAVMDLLRPDGEDELQHLLQAARGEPAVLRRDFENSLRAAYTTNEVLQQLQTNGLTQIEVEQVSERHWLAWGPVD